jgi:serine/threonine-protein kinase RsbW
MSGSGHDRTEFLHVSTPATLGQLPALRQQVRRCVAGLPISADRQAETILAVDEATTNAVQHAYEQGRPGVIDLTIWIECDALWIQVFDQGQWREPADEPSQSGHGLGLTLMRRLSDCVFIQHGSHGTKVLIRHQIHVPDLSTGGQHPAVHGHTRHRAGQRALF